jgi:hypothetical protein
MDNSTNKYLPYVFILFVLFLTTLIYAPGLSGSFVFDDYFNIQANKNIRIDAISFESLKSAALSFPSALGRPISMISFALNYYFSGLNPYYFKLTNLVIHLINGLGLYILTTLLLKSYYRLTNISHSPTHTNLLALAIAAVWLLHPLNLTSVLYVVQRMASLSTLFTIFGLALYTLGRQRICDGKPGIMHIIASLVIFTPLAALSKEIGVLLPAFMLVIEVTIFRFRTNKAWERKFLIFLFTGVIAIPLAIFAIYLLINPDWVSKLYFRRNFDVIERMMTETRVLWFYLQLIVFPNANKMGLFHDDYVLSKGLLEPATTLFSIFGIFGLLILSYKLRNRLPFFTFAVLFFFVGHSIESTFIGLETVHEHRNYLPQYGIILFVIYHLLNPRIIHKTFRIRQIAAFSIVVALAASTLIRSSYWGNDMAWSLVEVEHHPQSSRAQFQIGRIYATYLAGTNDPDEKEEYQSKAIDHFRKSFEVGGGYNFSGLFGIVTVQSTETGVVEEKYLEELKNNFRTQPFEANTANLVSGLIDCVSANRCKLSQGEMGEILQAALDNPTLKGTIRAHVLSHISGYLFNHVGNYRDAINLMFEATLVDPEATKPRLSLTRMLVAINDAENAQIQLVLLEKKDVFGINRKAIKELRQKIDAMKLATVK